MNSVHPLFSEAYDIFGRSYKIELYGVCRLVKDGCRFIPLK